MEIKITTKQVLKVLNVFSWIIFIGLCVEAGGILFNAIFIMTIKPLAAHQFWEGIDLSGLYKFDKGQFLVETLLMSIVGILKAILFYLIVRILHNKKLDLAKPFNMELNRFIGNMAWLALGIGLFSQWGAGYTKWLTSKQITMPDIQSLQFGGADVWLFMGVILFVIAQIFKQGIEIQSENDLTI